jgi:hypothetical protein
MRRMGGEGRARLRKHGPKGWLANKGKIRQKLSTNGEKATSFLPAGAPATMEATDGAE